MKRLSSILGLILCLSLFSLNLKAQDLKGNWAFLEITSAQGESLFEISTSDSLWIEDSTFHYQLAAKSLEAAGNYKILQDSLLFNYSTPQDTTRIYAITVLNDSLLDIEENGVHYRFQKSNSDSLAATLAVTNSNGLSENLPLDYDFTKAGFNLESLGRGLLGLTVLLSLTFLMSSKRRSINWRQVFSGLLIQIIFAVAILKVPFIRMGFDYLSQMFVTLLSFTDKGADFLFGELINERSSWGYIFAFKVLPTVIFFSALTSLLFYYGVMQKIVYAFAWVMKRTLRLSGAESLSAAGNIFLGQTESPLLVKPYLNKMTRSELLCVMSGGMATIAGGVLAAYIGFLGGAEEAQQIFFAKHLLAASVMSAPAAVVAAKILLPETKEFNTEMHIESTKIGGNALEAITNGTTEGLKLAVNVGAMLLVFIALVALLNSILKDFLGDVTGLNTWVQGFTDGQYDGFSLEFILGYTLAPITWLMGVAKDDIFLVGQLLGA